MAKKLIVGALAFFISSLAGATNSPFIYGGLYSKSVLDFLNLNDKVYVLTGTANPSVTATDAPKGSLYLRYGASGGTVWMKGDDGSSTNWTQGTPDANEAIGPGSATDNAVARWDGTGGHILQNSVTTIGDTGLLTTANIIVSGLTATTVPYLDASKQFTSSAVTPTELGYVSGVTSSLCGINQSCTVTNKTISGSSNTFSNIPNSATTAASANTLSAIVARDGSGNFTAGTITAALTGNASTATTAAALTSNPADCASNTYATTIAANGDLTCASITNASTTASSSAGNSTIVLRDGSGNFAAGTITAALTGNASTATALAANPSDCSASQFATAIAANGNLTCSAITYTTPTIQRFTSGTGTYTTPAGVSYIKVTVIGSGAGGQGSGTSGQGGGSNGAASTFGSSLLTANGGSAGSSETGGAGGSVTINSPALTIDGVAGGQGASAKFTSTGTADKFSGGIGGSSCLGGAGSGGGNTGDGQGAATNSGSGGGGGGVGTTASDITGNGGGAGGCLRAIIPAPSATYAYGVGAAGAGGAAGSSGNNGGSGAAGIVVVEEYYQ